jgi:hypothetical protein
MKGSGGEGEGEERRMFGNRNERGAETKAKAKAKAEAEGEAETETETEPKAKRSIMPEPEPEAKSQTEGEAWKPTEPELLFKLVHESDPSEAIVAYIALRLSDMIDLDSIGSSYERMEDELCRFEEWLHEVWGMGFYRYLLGRPEDRALLKAYRIAGEREANVLVADGLSLRELLFLKKALGPRLSYSIGRAFHPSNTATAARSFFGTSSLEEAFQGKRLIEGREWTGMVIGDVRAPPKIGGRRNLSLLTYYPDAPLHSAVKYGVAEIQDLSRVVGDLLRLVSELSQVSDLVITGDHGYIFLGKSPNRFLWRWSGRSERYGGSYGSYGLDADGVALALGRFHAPDVRRSGAFIVHGGVSLTESLVPVIIVKGGS